MVHASYFMRKFSTLFFISICAIVLLTSPFVVKANGVAIKIPNPLKAESFKELIDNIIDFLVKIGFPLALAVIIYAGIMFMASGGNEEKVTRAKKILLWAVIGYAIILMSKGIISVILNILEG